MPPPPQAMTRSPDSTMSLMVPISMISTGLGKQPRGGSRGGILHHDIVVFLFHLPGLFGGYELADWLEGLWKDGSFSSTRTWVIMVANGMSVMPRFSSSSRSAFCKS